jgi:hypothetical protein
MERVACNSGPALTLPVARMTSGESATNSAADWRVLSTLPATQRVSMRTLRPTSPRKNVLVIRGA